MQQEVVEFCRTHLTMNHQAFSNTKLHLVINDAKAELEKREEKFDIIVGDLADPVEGALLPTLHQNAGPAGILTHKQVFSSIYNTLKHVFKYVVAYSAHVPSFADTWGWVMASDKPLEVLVKKAEEIEARIEERIQGELLYLNGASLLSSATLNKAVSVSLMKETHVYTEDDARFLHGHGLASSSKLN
ncbi:Thermospermine synthase ACAULIS5 [Linum grandiflorum]